MGYRSHAALALSPEAVKQAHDPVYLGQIEVALNSCDDRYLVEGDTVYVWRQTNYFEEWECCRVIKDFLDGLEDWDFLYIRLGEDLADIERRGDLSVPGLRLVRSLLVPHDGEVLS